VAEFATAKGIGEVQAAAELLTMRRAFIAREASDHLRFGWEPSIWWVADALIDFPFCTTATAEVIRARLDVRGV
jgi:hypothetical protein